jgi:hypothetical protein
MEMTEGCRLGKWSVRLSPGGETVVYDNATDEDIATVHGSAEEALRRALLISRAPSFRDVVRDATEVFSAMREYGTERERATGEDMLPILVAVLYGLEHD